MDQVKEGSKTIILDLFQVSSAKKCKPNKGLDSPTPGPSTNDPNYATLSSVMANRIFSAATKNRRTTVPYQNDLSHKKIETMKFNSQWLQKYILVTV